MTDTQPLRRGGFITETIPGYHDDLVIGRGDDWECIEDILSSYCKGLGGDTLNVCAWLHKPSGITHFGGQWAREVPPADLGPRPTEEDVWAHAGKFSWVCKRMAGNARKEARWRERWDAMEMEQKKKGVNFLSVTLEKDGVRMDVRQPVGFRNKLEALQLVGMNLSDRNSKYFGMTIKKFNLERGTEQDLEKWCNKRK